MWYLDHTGKPSTMRIIAMMSSVVGCLAVVAGVVALFLRIPEAVAMSAIGAGMTGLGEISKAWQKSKE